VRAVAELDQQEEQVAAAAGMVAGADALLVAAGAGLGVDSGLPDFRGNAGFWRAYPALGQAGRSFTEVAQPSTFVQDAALAWGFYGHRLALYRRTQPHAGFALLQRWMARLPLGGRVFTSNVDGQFQRAGFADSAIHECHGSLHHLQCLNDCAGAIWPADGFEPQVDETACRLTNAAPACPHCGGLARPNVLMFGDWQWNDGRSARQARQEATWLARLHEAGARLAVVDLGAGTDIPSVRHFSERLVQQHGALLVRINPREPRVPPGGHVGLALGALEALTRMDRHLAG
jgi:NAD-dependent SIR2 family protein deacetylase